jgi:hypothetical protein
VRESKIEGYLRREIETLGGWMEKHTSPGTRGPPDNLVIWAAGHKWYETDTYVCMQYGTPLVEFIETKAPKKGPTVLQQKDHERRRAMGFQVHVIGSMEAAEQYLKSRGKR